MKETIKDKVMSFNRKYDRINKALNKHGMRLVKDAIFKGRYPHAVYMGCINDWQEIIQQEINGK